MNEEKPWSITLIVKGRDDKPKRQPLKGHAFPNRQRVRQFIHNHRWDGTFALAEQILIRHPDGSLEEYKHKSKYER